MPALKKAVTDNNEYAFESFATADPALFRQKLILYCRQYEQYTVLDSNGFYAARDLNARPYYHQYELLAGIGSTELISVDAGGAFEALEAFRQKAKGFVFGYLGYDLKNEIEKLSSHNTDVLHSADLFFFQALHVVRMEGTKVFILSDNSEQLFQDILATPVDTDESPAPGIVMQPRMSKDYYLETVEKIRDHIREGDVYEMNFCQEFYAENADIDPETLFLKLTTVSPQPFSALMRNAGQYVISASMERFLCKRGDKLVSQPIKGTIRRGQTADEDAALCRQLANDEKEKAENVMIVDLVRNDLAKNAVPGTVKVEELWGIYEFPFVHHMISTVSAQMENPAAWIQAIKAAFPMGSMTGAPKVMAMELIEQYELSKRGIFSGALGYISPDDDFDFNVVIRSFIYDRPTKYLSLHVGSAITYDSVPENEFEECMVKIEGVRGVV